MSTYLAKGKAGSDSPTAKRLATGVCQGSPELSIINGCPVLQWVRYGTLAAQRLSVPSIGQNPQPFKGIGDVSTGVKNSRRKTVNKQKPPTNSVFFRSSVPTEYLSIIVFFKDYFYYPLLRFFQFFRAFGFQLKAPKVLNLEHYYY